MEIEVNEIKVNERIRKKFIEIDDLADSIKELGQIQAVVIDKDMNLIAGHRRLLACKKLGIKVKVEVVNVNDELHHLDMELAENVKRDDFNPIDLAEGLQKRKELYEALHPETMAGVAGGKASGISRGTKTDSDFVQEPTFVTDTAKKIGKSETFVKEHLQLNDLKEETKQRLRDNKLKKSEALAIFRKQKKKEAIKEKVKGVTPINLYEGDCLEQLDKVQDDSVACLIIDPPYGIDYQSNYKLAKHDKIQNDKEEVFDLLDKSLTYVNKKLLDNSHIYIFTSWKVFEDIKPIVEKHFEVKNCLIWNKNNWSMGDLQGNYAEKYEMIIFATKGNRILFGDKRPVNVLDFGRTSNLNHPTEKPVELLKELIKNSTVEGEIVLDYFAGSGSTLLAAKELNRKFIGIEKSPEYCDIIKSRIMGNKIK